MSRRFIATVVAAAVAVTVSGNAPARANDDAARALAAFVGLAIVGAAIHSHTKKSKKDKKSDDTSVVSRRNIDDDGIFYPRGVYREPVIERAKSRRAKRRFLPGKCLRSIEDRGWRYRVFTKKCLEKNYSYIKSLPESCAVKLRVKGKKRHGYRARCLRRAGYKLALS